MIIHSVPHFRIYFGDSSDQMYPQEYLLWDNPNLCGRDQTISIVERLRLKNLFFLRQVHGVDGLVITNKNKDHIAPFSSEGDFIVTQEQNIGIGVLTADCLPVIFYDRKNHVAGIAHAGWRGAVAGIIPRMLSALKESYGSNLQELSIFFGPSARRCCYEVGVGFEKNLEYYPYADQTIHRVGGKYFFDLPYFVELQLLQLGAPPSAICKEYNACTMCNLNFHSHRRGSLAGRADTVGRQMTIIALR